MFHFDITCEDNRLIATEVPHAAGNPPSALRVQLIDQHSGSRHVLEEVSFCDLEKLVAGMICCHGEVPPDDYPHLEKLLEGCPAQCRPIP